MDRTVTAILAAALMVIGVVMTFGGWLAYLAGANLAGETVGFIGLALMIAPHLVYHGQGQQLQHGKHGI